MEAKELDGREVRIALHATETDGGTLLTAEYDPEDLGPLCTAMAADGDLRRAATEVAAYAIASAPDPGKALEALMGRAEAMLREIEGETHETNR